MERVKWELEKILKAKILWALLLVFLGFNIFVVVGDSYNKGDLKILNTIIDKVGMNLNTEGEENLKKYYEVEKEKIQALIEKKTNEKNVELEKVLTGGVNNSLFSKEELEKIYEISIVEGYYFAFQNNLERYSKIDLVKKAKKHVKNLDNISEKVKEKYIRNFENFNGKLEEIKESGENRNFHIDGMYYMHKKLFKDTLGKIGFQGVIIIVMLTAFLYNYEFENKTSHLVYSTTKGRNDKDKLKAAIIGSVIFLSILLIGTLVSFFSIYDYSRVFNSPINSVLNWESFYPQLSWISITVKEFLILDIFIIYIVSIMTVFIGSYVSKILKNTYTTFFCSAIIYGVLYLLPDITRGNLVVQGISTYNPVTLIEGISCSFSVFSTVFPNKYFEVTTIIIWSVLIYVGYGISNKKFKKEDI